MVCTPDDAPQSKAPRVNLTRFHGIFAPNHRLRAQIVPGKRGRGAGQAAGEKAPLPRHDMPDSRDFSVMPGS
jgi:hypothetical protein